MEERWNSTVLSQKMKCPYCDTEISVEEYEALNESQTSEDKKSGQTEKNTKESTFVTYICESCGGEITADKTTGQQPVRSAGTVLY